MSFERDWGLGSVFLRMCLVECSCTWAVCIANAPKNGWQKCECEMVLQRGKQDPWAMSKHTTPDNPQTNKQTTRQAATTMHYQPNHQQGGAQPSYGAGGSYGAAAEDPYQQQQQPLPPQAVSSKRMTYGSISNSTREARERQELFAGADNSGRGRGGGPSYGYQQQQQQQQYMPQDELSNDELMQQAVEQHKDTTATARRALQVCPCQRLVGGCVAGWCVVCTVLLRQGAL